MNELAQWFIDNGAECRSTAPHRVISTKDGEIQLDADTNEVSIYSGLGMSDDYGYRIKNPPISLLAALLKASNHHQS